MRNRHRARSSIMILAMVAAALGLAACGGSNATPTATLAPRPTDPPLSTQAPQVESPTEAALLPTASADPTPDLLNAGKAVGISTLENYTYKTGLFTIQVPAGWKHTESSTDTVSAAWVAPDRSSGIFIGLKQTSDTLTQQELVDFANAYVQSVFGSEDSFQSNNAVPQSDGSVLVPFAFRPRDNPTVTSMIGLTYVEQRGDKVSGLTVMFPEPNSEQLWNDYFQTIVNSYKIDESVSIQAAP